MNATERRYATWGWIALVGIVVFAVAALYIGDNIESLWWAALAFAGGVVVGTAYPGKSVFEELTDSIEENQP